MSLGICCLHAEDGGKPLPPVDVTESKTIVTVDAQSGWVSIDALDEKNEAKPLPPVVDEQTLASSRALMNSLRRGGPVSAAKSTATTTAKSVQADAASSSALSQPLNEWISASQADLKVNRILQTAGQDDQAGVISIPSLDEHLPPVVEAPLTGRFSDSLMDAPTVVPDPIEGCVSLKQLKKDTKKEKRRSRLARVGGRLIEFYDPDLERLDVDEYDRTILLISNTDEPTETASIKEDSGAKTASELFSRKITDIKPTLEYAWGDEDASKLPDDFYSKLDNGEYVSRVAPRTVLQWEPTNLWYHPLYFEDPGLERYGHTQRPLLQPLVSSGRFFGQVAMLPYQMTLHPPSSKEFALGYYQPGEWAPKKRYRIPFNEEASAVQFLWITGLVLLIP